MKFSAYGWTVVATLVVLAGCDLVPGEDGRKAPPTAKVPTGTWAVDAGRVDATLDVTASVFTANLVDRPTTLSSSSIHSVTSSTRRFKPAATDEDPAWVVMVGEVSVEGDTVTLRITGVEVDGTEIEGEALTQYTGCLIEAIIGENFEDQVVSVVVDCVNAAGHLTVSPQQVTVSPSPVRGDPVAALIGSWTYRGTHTDCTSDVETMESECHTIATTWTLTVSRNAYEWRADSSCGYYGPNNECVRVTVAVLFDFDVSKTAISAKATEITINGTPSDEQYFALFNSHWGTSYPYVVSSDGRRLSMRSPSMYDPSEDTEYYFTRN